MKERIREICRQGVIGVGPDDQAFEAVRCMRDRTISCVVVLDQGRPVGIFTERDLVRRIAREGTSFRSLPMREVMSSSLRTVSEEGFLFDAFDTLAAHGIRHLVVVDAEGRATGVVTQSDLLLHMGYDYFVKVKTISQIMNTDVQSVPPSSTVIEASQRMATHGVSFLVASEDGKPLGVLTERDVTRLVAEEADLSESLVGQVMSSPAVCVDQGTSAFDAVKTMQQHGIRRIVVVDEAGLTAGVTTQSDMVKGLESKYIENLKKCVLDQSSELNTVVRDLSEKTLYLDSILSASIDMGITATDAEGRIVYYNPAAEKILGHSSAEVIGQSLEDIHEFVGVSRARLAKAIKAVVGLRVSEEDEVMGLDLAVHGERGYSLDLSEGGRGTRALSFLEEHSMTAAARSPLPGASGA